MARHLDRIEIRRFRGLRDLVLDDLGLVNVLVGPNASGKTSVLEAVGTFCRPLDPLAWLETAQRREGVRSSETEVEALKWLFPQGQRAEHRGELSTSVAGFGSFPVRESRATYAELLGSASIDAPSPRLGAELELQAVLGTGACGQSPPRTEIRTFKLSEGERFLTRREPGLPELPVQALTSVSHVLEPLAIGWLTETILRGIKNEVLDVLREIDPKIEDLAILSRSGLRPGLYVKHQRTGHSPLSSLGDGARRTLVMALSVVRAESGVLLIDDIEAAIHKNALTRVFAWLADACKRRHVQLFAATHSLDAVDAILGVDSLEYEDIATYQLHEEAVPPKRFGGEQLHRLRYEMGLDVR